MYYEEKTNKAYHIIAMLISPIFGLILLLKSKTKEHITLMGTLFFGLVGSLFIYVPGNDGYSHLQDVKLHYMDMSFGEFLSNTYMLLTLQSVEVSKDLYKHIISYLAGGIFQTPELIHVFGGLLLGYFFTKSILLVTEVVPKHKKSTLLLGFIVLFLIVRSISALNSIRMWVAMWVFFYGAMAYIKRKDYKYLIFVGLAIFIHFSYTLFLIPLLGAVILRKQKLIIIGIFAASFFINIGFDQASSLVESAGVYEDSGGSNIIDKEEKDRRRIQGEEKSEERDAHIYREFGPTLYKKYSIPLLSFVLVFIYLVNRKYEYIDFLIAGGLLLTALSNVAETTSPAVHGRGNTIAATFLTAAAIQVIALRMTSSFSKTKRDLINTSFRVFLFSAILHIVFHLSYAINIISMFSIGLPVSSWILGADDLSLKEFIKQFIF